MPLKKTELIVLKRTKVQDSSLFLICLTKEHGKLPLVARGATKPGSSMAEALQYFTVADVVFYEHEKGTAEYISKADINETFTKIIGDENRFGFASAAMEFVNLYMPEGEANPQVYFLLKRYLRLLDRSSQQNFRRELLHFWYLLTIFCGYAPELERCGDCGNAITTDKIMFDPQRGGVICDSCIGDELALQIDRGTIAALKKLAGTNIAESAKVTLTPPQMAQIRDLLVALTEYHIGRRVDLKSLDFLRKLRLFESE